MAIQQTTPPAAYERLTGDDGVTYVDVRTPEEFERGHPEGAWNIPVVFLDPNGGPAKPNPDFLTVVQRHLRPDQSLLIGCLSGGRSQRACAILADAGFTDLTNVQGGFGGARDRAGQTVVEGWRDSGLPVATGQPTDRSYAYLSATK